MSMRNYVNTVGADRFPIDPWLSTDLHAAGVLVKIAPYSMTIVGRIADCSLWTGMSSDQSGEVSITGALVPAMVSLEHLNKITRFTSNLTYGFGTRCDDHPA